MSFRPWFNHQKDPSLLFDNTGVDLITKLEKNVYGDSNSRNIVYFEKKDIVFHPSSQRDHLTTKFLQVPLKRKDQFIRSISIKLGFNELSTSTEKCCIDIQDENFVFIGRIDCNKILADKKIR